MSINYQATRLLVSFKVLSIGLNPALYHLLNNLMDPPHDGLAHAIGVALGIYSPTARLGWFEQHGGSLLIFDIGFSSNHTSHDRAHIDFRNKAESCTTLEAIPAHDANACRFYVFETLVEKEDLFKAHVEQLGFVHLFTTDQRLGNVRWAPLNR